MLDSQKSLGPSSWTRQVLGLIGDGLGTQLEGAAPLPLDSSDYFPRIQSGMTPTS